jgi:hypothetical protein
MYQANGVPYDIRLNVERELQQGEKIRWIGKPKFSSLLLKGLIVIVAFVVLGGLFTYFGGRLVYRGLYSTSNDSETSMWPFGIIIVLIGLGGLYVPVWLVRRLCRIAFVVTDTRAIIVGAHRKKKMESYGPKQLKKLTKRTRRDGSGDLVFGKHISYSKGERHEAEYGFLGIADVDEVEKLLKAIVDRAQTEQD